MLELYHIRHAESVANQSLHVVNGQSNHTPLSNLGVAQAQALGKYLEHYQLKFDQVHSSTAVRTQQTAKLAGFTQVTTTPKLLEIGQGDFTGQPKSVVYSKSTLQQIATDPWNFCPPNGESQADVARRMWEYTNNVLTSVNPEVPQKIAFFTHGLAIKTWMTQLLNIDRAHTWLIEIDNVSITRFNYCKVGGVWTWHMGCVNDCGYKQFINFSNLQKQ